MKEMSPESISHETRAWFGNQIQRVATRHDLAGPHISRLRRSLYRKQLVHELRTRAKAAVEAGTLLVSVKELDRYCKRAAAELITLREIRAAHASGALTTEAMRQLPAYSAFQDYLDEAPPLVYAELMAMVRERLNAEPESIDPEPLSQPDHPAHPPSAQTRAWMELQAFALASADDAWGPVFGSVPQDDYITDSALRIRRRARRAVAIGDLQVLPEDLDQVCWVAAGEAFLLRSLKAARQNGELSDQEIRQMPIYGPYKEYFQESSNLVGLAAKIAAAAGLPVMQPKERN
jgi:hypothetical protein